MRSGLLAENLTVTLCAAALMGLLGALATVVFREVLGWAPRHSLAESLAKTVAGYREQGLLA